MEKKKFTLKKSVISRLTREEQGKIIGGEDALWSSNKNCTGFLCCDTLPRATEDTGPDPRCDWDVSDPRAPGCASYTCAILD
ncbi:MAG: hypothetical protein EOO90_03800 [Pedobacter sp.]|nr:MAG: hypothetical protein EOO90_03800 [Pedobacter sp.]